MNKFLLNPKGFRIDVGLLILRVFTGLSMAFTHGLPKLNRMIEKDFSEYDILGWGPVAFTLAVFAEFICSLLLALGLYTRLSLIPLIFTMMVAGFYAHWSDPWGKKEMAVLYLVIFIVIFFTGPGKYSFDFMISRKNPIR